MRPNQTFIAVTVFSVKLMRVVSCWALTAHRCSLLLLPGNRLPGGLLPWPSLYLWSWVGCGHRILTFSPWACPGSQKVIAAVRPCWLVLSPPYRSSVWHYPGKKRRNKNKDLSTVTEECGRVWNVVVVATGKIKSNKMRTAMSKSVIGKKKKNGKWGWKILYSLPQLVTKNVSLLNHFWDLLPFSECNQTKEQQRQRDTDPFSVLPAAGFISAVVLTDWWLTCNSVNVPLWRRRNWLKHQGG